MNYKTTLLGLLLAVTTASAVDLREAFHDLHKQSVDTLLNIHEKVLSDSQRLLLNKELQVREREMNREQRERLYAHPSYHGNAYGHDHAPGQQKKQGGEKGGKHH
jgi:hypothetical protein